MTITIETDELIHGIRESFFQESAGIPSEISGARDAGIVTESEFERVLVSADAAVRTSFDRFLHNPVNKNSDNSRSVPEYFTFDFRITPRGAAGRESFINQTIHNCMVDHCLGTIFQNLLPEIATAHMTAYSDGVTEIRSLLLLKRKPLTP